MNLSKEELVFLKLFMRDGWFYCDVRNKSFSERQLFNSIQKKLPVIEAQLQSLSEEARNHYSSQVDIIKSETRALGTSIKKTKIQQSSNKNIKLRAD